MTATNRLGKDIKYHHHLYADKHYFGGFLNLANDNIEQVKKLFRKKIKNDHRFLSTDSNHLIAYDDWEKGIDFLKQYLPVVHYLALPVNHEKFSNLTNKEKGRRDYFTIHFNLLTSVISNCRNFYTHYYHDPITVHDDVFKLLDELFILVCRDVRKHRIKTDKTGWLLKRTLQNELQILTKHKKHTLEKQKKEGKKVNLDAEAIENAVMNDAFKHLRYTDKEDNKGNIKKFLVKDQYKSAYNEQEPSENKICLSKSGLLFLCSMFLSRKAGEDMRARVSGFKEKFVYRTEEEITDKNNSLRSMVTQWVFSHLAFKDIKQRITTNLDRETLFVQIVDYLSKVPDELYQVFSDTQKKEFLEDINEYIKEGNETRSLIQSTVAHPVIRKRYENQFNYFVLRYLDEFKNFPSLRFQINTGFYTHDQREKMIEGTEYLTDRKVKEKIKVFGKLSEVTTLKNEFLVKNTDLQGWEEYPRPSYNINNNNIPIFINIPSNAVEDDNKINIEIHNQRNLKQSTRTEDKKQKSAIADMLNTNGEIDLQYKEPTAIINLKELPSLLHELLIKNTLPQNIEKRLQRKIVEHLDSIARHTHHTDSLFKGMPRKLKKSSEEASIHYEKLKSIIESQLQKTAEKQNFLKEKKDLLNKKKTDKPLYLLNNREMGKEATWLASDLIRFMPENVRKQWKGHHHSQLQQTLAFYEHKREEALSLIGQFWNFNTGPYWREAFKKAFEQTTFEDFYFEYLKMRQAILTNFLGNMSISQLQPNLAKKALKECWIVFHKRQFVIRPTQEQISKLLAQPTVLPRGLFDNKPTYIENVKLEDDPKKFASWYRYTYNDHPMQRFYSFDRDYTSLYEEFQSNKDVILNKKQLTKSEQEALLKKKQDLKIKDIRTQDLFLKLIADKLFEEIFNQKADFTLEDIYQTREERIHNREQALQQSERVPGDDFENIYNENFVLNKTVPFIQKQIHEPTVKIKDLGKFKRFLLDNKVKALFSYEPNRVWSIQELENELTLLSTSYEVIRRVSLLKAIQEFEKYIMECWGDSDTTKLDQKDKKSGKYNPSFKKYIFNGVLDKFRLANAENIKHIIDYKEFEELVDDPQLKSFEEIVRKAYILTIIRNKITHNQLPDKANMDFIQGMYPKEPQDSYSQYLLRVTQLIIDEMVLLMKI